MNKELIDYLKNYQRWRRGAEMEHPDPTELGEKLDEAIQILEEDGVLHESHIGMQASFDKEVLELIEPRAKQEWRRDLIEVGEKLDEAIELLNISRLRESRESHPLTTKEEAEKQVAEFDKVQPPADCRLNSTIEDEDENKEWEEVYDIIDTIVEERDKYKKALKDLKEWVEEEELYYAPISGMNDDQDFDFGKGCTYHDVKKKINEVLEETYKIEIGDETIDFPKD